MSASISIGLIGLGRMGKIHLEHLYRHIKGVNMVAVTDLAYPAAIFNSEFPGIPFTQDVDSVITDPLIDAVVICTPTSTHASLVEKAIVAGKHIFCEKPLDLSLDITQQLLRKAANANVKLMLGFNRRFDTEFLQAKQSIIAGAVGRPQIIKITNRDPGIPPIEFIKTSGGMFMDFSIHDFDMARYIMNKKVVEVFAKGLVFIDEAIGAAGDIDTALITLTFEDGTYAVIDNSRKAVYGYDQRLEIFGDAGMILVDNNHYHQNRLYNASGIHQALPYNSFTVRYLNSYLREMKLFIDAITHHTNLPISEEDVMMATAIAYAAQQSMQTGRPVTI